MTFKRLAITLGISAAFGLGAAGQANATAMANSLIDISRFIITDSASTPLALTDFSQLNFTDDLSNRARLNATVVNTSAFTNTFAASTDPLLACVGACGAFGENNFTPGTVPPTATYARADSLLANQPISGTGFPTGVRAATISETSLNNVTGSGASNNSILLTSGFTFVLAHGIGSVGLDFDATTFLRAWTASGSLPGTSAGAGFKWEITLTDQAGNKLLDWIPDGDILSGTQIGLTVTDEDCNLVANASATFDTPAPALENCTGHFAAHTNFALAANTAYSFTINQVTSTQAVEVERTVPEPGALALFGIALAGLGFIRRRKS